MTALDNLHLSVCLHCYESGVPRNCDVTLSDVIPDVPTQTGSNPWYSPQVLLSDNHRSFLATERFLHDFQQDPEIQDFVAARRITWRRQTPQAPWPGGHFERLVRTIKVALATAVSKKLLTLEEFTTVVKESEAIVNNRPLTYQQVDSQDIPLTLKGRISFRKDAM